MSAKYFELVRIFAFLRCFFIVEYYLNRKKFCFIIAHWRVPNAFQSGAIPTLDLSSFDVWTMTVCHLLNLVLHFSFISCQKMPEK